MPTVFPPISPSELRGLWAMSERYSHEIPQRDDAHVRNELAVSALFVRAGAMSSQKRQDLAPDVAGALMAASRAPSLTVAHGFLSRFLALREILARTDLPGELRNRLDFKMAPALGGFIAMPAVEVIPDQVLIDALSSMEIALEGSRFLVDEAVLLERVQQALELAEQLPKTILDLRCAGAPYMPRILDEWTLGEKAVSWVAGSLGADLWSEARKALARRWMKGDALNQPMVEADLETLEATGRLSGSQLVVLRSLIDATLTQDVAPDPS